MHMDDALGRCAWATHPADNEEPPNLSLAAASTARGEEVNQPNLVRTRSWPGVDVLDRLPALDPAFPASLSRIPGRGDASRRPLRAQRFALLRASGAKKHVFRSLLGVVA